jgi:hypothetical protein
MENLELAAKKAVKSKKNKKDVRKFLRDKTELLKKLQQDLINGKFNTSPYRIRTIFEPKKRDIYILPLYPDHVVHHALINILGPIWQSTFINDSYACIPGRGLHSASKRVMQFVRRYKYVLQCDIKKFYPSVNHKIMFKIIKKKVKDDRLLAVLQNIIFSCGNGRNLPIGNLTSQWMGNVYMNEADHFIKEQLHCRAYIRYCDDFLIFSDDKAWLHKCKKDIEEFLMNNLNLIFSKSSVFPVSRGVSFLGYRHFRKFILLRKHSAKKIFRCLFFIVLNRDLSERSVCRLAAWHGWIKWSCSYNLKKCMRKMLAPVNPLMDDFIYERFVMLDPE